MSSEILLSSPEKGIELHRLHSGGYEVRTRSPSTGRLLASHPFKTLKAARGYYNKRWSRSSGARAPVYSWRKSQPKQRPS
jgi:hypothetical protein